MTAAVMMDSRIFDHSFPPTNLPLRLAQRCKELDLGDDIEQENGTSIGSKPGIAHDTEDLFPTPSSTKAFKTLIPNQGER